MRCYLLAASAALSFLLAPPLHADEKREFRALSEKGSKIVASRTYKGREVTKSMIKRVNDVDLAYREHISLYKEMASCKKTKKDIVTYTPNGKIDSKYSLTPERKGKGEGAPDTCIFETSTVSEATVWDVNCTLTMKEANTISDEAILSYSNAIERFRNDGLYSNVSPSTTLSKLQQTKSCKMKIDMQSFE
jgi:hypothetical protein